MRYWYSTATGRLKAVAAAVLRPVGHSGYALTADVADLPGPLACCRWDGAAIVVDSASLADLKADLRLRVEAKYLSAVQEGILTTPAGDFRVRRDDIDAYQMIGFAALYAIQTSSPFSVNLRKADDSTVTVTAAQFVRLLALIGGRMAAKLAARDARLDQLAAASAEQLKAFVP